MHQITLDAGPGDSLARRFPGPDRGGVMALVSVGGYPTLFAATAAIAACGSIFVWKIKSVP
jgi:hypothetical protein